MHGEGHDAGRKDIVLHESVPCCPGFLEGVEVDVVVCDFIEVVVVCYRLSREGRVPTWRSDIA